MFPHRRPHPLFQVDDEPIQLVSRRQGAEHLAYADSFCAIHSISTRPRARYSIFHRQLFASPLRRYTFEVSQRVETRARTHVLQQRALAASKTLTLELAVSSLQVGIPLHLALMLSSCDPHISPMHVAHGLELASPTPWCAP
jgi:hypothetical protein